MVQNRATTALNIAKLQHCRLWSILILNQFHSRQGIDSTTAFHVLSHVFRIGAQLCGCSISTEWSGKSNSDSTVVQQMIPQHELVLQARSNVTKDELIKRPTLLGLRYHSPIIPVS